MKVGILTYNPVLRHRGFGPSSASMVFTPPSVPPFRGGQKPLKGGGEIKGGGIEVRPYIYSLIINNLKTKTNKTMKKLLLLTKTLLAAALLCVGQNAWGESLNATVKMTYVDKYNGNADVAMGEITGDNTAKAGFNTISNNTVAQPGTDWSTGYITYLQVDASALPSGATITNATLSFKQSGSTDSKRTSGVGAGYNSSTWSSTMTYNSADRSITLLGDVVWTSTKQAGTFEDKEINITAAFDEEDDNVVTILLYETAAAGCYIKNPAVTVTYTTGSAYDITFTETNSVAATVKINDTDVTSGTKLVNGNYSFTATAAGYENYNGNFTVSGADKNVEFTMTPRTAVTSFVLKYKNKANGSVIDTKAIDMTGRYVGDSYTYAYQKYWADGGDLYVKDAANTRANCTLEATNEITVNYNLSASGNYYFYEFDGGYTTRADAESNGSAAKQSANVTVPADGIYIVTANCYGSTSTRTATVKVGETTIVPSTTLSIYAPGTNLVSSPVVLNKDDVINVTTSSSGDGIDYVILQKLPSTVSVTVTDAGYATYVPSYDLNFSETGIKAYKVKVNTKGVATMTQVDNVPANTPVLLYKDGGAEENIPVMTGAAAVSDNDLVAGTGAAVATTDGEYTNMILNNVGGNIGFYFANGQEVAANRAYLHIATDLAPAATARMAMRFAGDNITGVANVEAAAEAKAKEGKFVEGNQLYIYKNGVKFNAAGQQVK